MLYKDKRDEQLIEIILANEQESEYAADQSFREIYYRYYKMVFKFIHNSIDNIDDCMDLFQQTFLKIYSNLDRYNPKFQFSTWIYKIALNVVRNFKTTEMRAHKFFKEYKLIKKVSFNPDYVNIIYEAKIAEDLHKEIQKLPEKLGAPFTLFAIGKIHIKEIAKIFKITESAIRKRITKAKAILKKNLFEKV